MRHGISRVTRQLGRQLQKRRPLLFIAVFPNMERHHGIGVGGDHIGAGFDEFIMNIADHLRRFHQRQRGPFWLLERGAIGFQLSSQPTV